MYGTSSVEEILTLTPMVRVRRWRWWPFAHEWVPAPTVHIRDVVKYVSPERELLVVTGIEEGKCE